MTCGIEPLATGARRGARDLKGQRVAEGSSGMEEGRTWFRHSTLVRSISSRRSASAAPMVSAGRATGSDEGVGRCARESGACGGNLDGSVEPAASARVLNSARRQLSFTPRVAAPRAARQDAETRARVRLFHLRSLPSLRGWRDLRRVRVRGRARVVPVPRAADVAPPSDRRSVSPPLFCRSHQPPTPGSAPLPSAFPSEILPQFLYLGSYDHSTRAEVLRAHGITHMLNCVPTCQVLHRTQFTTHTVSAVAAAPRDASGASASSLESRPDPQEVPLDECVAFLEGVAREGRRVLVWDMSGSSKAPSAVIAYLMRSRGWRLVEAYRWVKSRREAVNLRPVAAAQLTRYEVAVFGHTANTSRDTNDFAGAARVDGAVGGVGVAAAGTSDGGGGAGEFAFAGGHAGGFAFCQPVDGAPFVFGGGGGGGPNGG